MMKCRGHYCDMKNIITNIILILFLIITGCKNSDKIKFCEGVSKDEKGMNCGTTFSTGDITALINTGEAFETDKLTITIFEAKKYKDEKVNSIFLDVNPEKEIAYTSLSLYNEGTFKFKVIGKEEKTIAEGEVNIVDSY